MDPEGHQLALDEARRLGVVVHVGKRATKEATFSEYTLTCALEPEVTVLRQCNTVIESQKATTNGRNRGAPLGLH
jgi:hypothetical protein